MKGRKMGLSPRLLTKEEDEEELKALDKELKEQKEKTNQIIKNLKKEEKRADWENWERGIKSKKNERPTYKKTHRALLYSFFILVILGIHAIYKNEARDNTNGAHPIKGDQAIDGLGVKFFNPSFFALDFFPFYFFIQTLDKKSIP